MCKIKKEVFVINQNGFIIDKHVAEFDNEGNCVEEPAKDIITVKPQDGMFRPRWTGAEWVEDMTQEEIDELNNRPSLPSLEERLQMAEDTILFLLGGM